jgi:hypothetical protein
MPTAHDSFEAHRTPQAPQFAGSVVMSTQALPHRAVPSAQGASVGCPVSATASEEPSGVPIDASGLPVDASFPCHSLGGPATTFSQVLFPSPPLPPPALPPLRV